MRHTKTWFPSRADGDGCLGTFVTGRIGIEDETDLVKSTVESGGTLELSAEECWDLLTASTVGRVGFTEADSVKIIPVNYVLDGRTLIIRTNPASSVAAIAESAIDIAFQVDYHDAISGSGWSVLLNGTAVALTAEEAESLNLPARVPWAGGDRSLHLRFSPRTIQGRRVRRRRQAAGAGVGRQDFRHLRARN